MDKQKYNIFSPRRMILIKSAIVLSGTLILVFIELSFIITIGSKYYQPIIIGLILLCAVFVTSTLSLMINRRNQMLRKLEESEKKYRSLTDYSMTGIIICISNKIEFVNPQVEKLTDFERNELIGLNFYEIAYKDDNDKLKQILLNGNKAVINRLEIRLRSKRRHFIWCEMVTSTIMYQGRTAIMANIIDITAARRRRERLSVIHKISEALVNQMEENKVYQLAISKSIEIFNADAAVAYTFQDDSLELAYYQGLPMAFKNKNNKLPIDSTLLGNLCRDKKSILINNFDNNKHYEPFFYDQKYKSMIIKPVLFEEKPLGIIAFFAKLDSEFDTEDLSILESISDQVAGAITRDRLYRKIQFQSVHDPLTNLYNRRYLNQVSSTILSSSDDRTALILMIDIDRFKEVNDRFGHLEGDRVLKETAEIIVCSVRENDIVFRFGGDEFLILMPGADDDDFEYISKKLTKRIEAWSKIQDNIDFEITLSIGKSLWIDSSEESIEKIIQKADQRMYSRKRNCQS